MTEKNTLICTVGGSHQPIVSAIEELRPAYVCFVCSSRDPGTGQAGSSEQILKKGNCIKADRNDKAPTLPNIPTQAGLAEGQYEVVDAPADDLDAIYLACTRAIDTLRERFPGAALFADYTGGTKSMTAGLVMAALECPEVTLNLVTGNRVDLVKVQDGYQSVATANVEAVRLQRAMGPPLLGWQRYAYGEAANALRGIALPRDANQRARLQRARSLSEAFAAWDRFDHARARETLRNYAPVLSDGQKRLIGTLMQLQDRDPDKWETAHLLDLYRNAERRAAQGRYDDAVARLYRLLEWTGQWILKRELDIQTGDIPEDFDAGGVQLTRSRDGKRQAGLYATWELIGVRTQGEARDFSRDQLQNLMHYVQIRNHSILAHGFTPISKQEWSTMYAWVETVFVPMLTAEASKAGISGLPPQLPAVYEEAAR